MSELDLVEAAYWHWLKEYGLRVNPINCGPAARARQELLLTKKLVAQRMGVAASTLTALEQKEKNGRATLGALARMAQAMECELLVAVVPKAQEKEFRGDFSRVVWAKLWPVALQAPQVRAAHPERKAQALAAVAVELMSKRL